MNNDQPQNENLSPDADESRLTAQLRSIEMDAAPSDPTRLAEIRNMTLQVFEDEQVAVSDRKQPSIREVARSKSPVSTRIAQLAALAATIAIVALGLNLFSHNSVSGAPFSKVLENLRTAKTLELRISKDGQSTQVWVRAPGLVRFDDSPQQYRIAQGSRLWKIDESANTAAPSDSPWFIDPQHQVDLLGLLELGVKDGKPLASAGPEEHADYAGRKCVVYRADLPGQGGKLRVEAFADAKTSELVGIIANPTDRPRVGPPLAELQLIAMNPPVDESKFVVAKSLTDDGRIGKVAEAQGLVVLRPALAQRWTPVGPALPLKPGDWVRTDLRGANAVKLRMSSEAELTLGPGTLLECLSPNQARLHTGEAQLNLPKPSDEKSKGEATQFELLAPKTGSQKFTKPGKLLVRLDRSEKLVEAEGTPLWLKGFEGTSSDESLGSLIVTLPDGTNEPLTVGYHKVNVEIRDQIARTTIEESFVNHTRGRLEGEFYFPLPADASISGFGMWIGNDLVEADVVEKQRAREIYETIKREWKDPGLLEWTAGNLFKARVFPIEALSEKRIKIVYTQVLPLRGNQYRYSYGLRSDMLRTKPLRELAVSVQVNSALPLKSVTCPTHPVRTQETKHSAQLDFAAQEYIPDRDFEVVCEVESGNSDVVVIPHRRGEDGYFLMQLMPPGAQGNFQREVLPDGKPLKLVLLCDTSASMDGEKRKQQAEFVATVLSSLAEKDRFWLAAADVETVWASPEAMQATEENVTKAREFLDGRGSLGWTNLEKAFESVLKKAGAGAQIIYIGDGVVTAGESDPNSFVKRLGRLLVGSGFTKNPGGQIAPSEPNAEPRTPNPSIQFHAVTVGNTYDATVLKGIAAVGHGSVRSITADLSPQAVGKELLNEIAQPGLRDLKVEFHGVKVAAVYPDTLPAVPAGTQQILVGRYLPQAQGSPSLGFQTGEAVVTGTLGDKPVKYVAKIEFKDAEEGNSFIPRLWARAHLDHLLQQGASQAIRDEIISLSEQFHIITPYTSLLVLESDADRERFGVKRRFEMRDGERFFAEGHKNANYELQQQQMKRAGDWRVGMRYRVLQNLAGLGRNGQIFQQQIQGLNMLKGRIEDERFTTPSPTAGPVFGAGGISGFDNSLSLIVEQTQTVHEWNGGALYKFGTGALSLSSSNTYLGDTEISAGSLITATGAINSPLSWAEPAFGPTGGMGGGGGGGFRADRGSMAGEWSDRWDGEKELGDFDELARRSLDGAEDARAIAGKDMLAADSIDFGLPMQPGAQAASLMPFINDSADDQFAIGGKLEALDAPVYAANRMRGLWAGDINGNFSGLNFETAAEMPAFGRRGGWAISKGLRSSPYWYNQPNYTTWASTLFPPLMSPAHDPAKIMADFAKQKSAGNWSEEAISLSNSLLRFDSLWKLDGGIEVRRTTETFDPRWKRMTSLDRDLVLYSPNSWLKRSLNPEAQTLIEFCDEKDRGVYSLSFLLGRTRKSFAGDLKAPPLVMADFSTSLLGQTYRSYDAKVEPAGENQARLVLTMKNSKTELRFVVDTKRHVLLKSETVDEDKIVSSTTYSDFIEIGGSWWARSIVLSDAKGRPTSQTKLEISQLDKEKFANRVSDEMSAKPQVAFLHLPGPMLKTARQHVADNKADFDDRVTMMLLNCLTQQWDDLFAQLDAAEKVAADKPGTRWIRTVVLQTIRRNEEARVRLLDEAKKLAAKPQQDELNLAQFIIGQCRGIASPAEQLEFVNTLKPVFDRQGENVQGPIRWQEQLLSCYDSLGRGEDALAIRGKLAEQSPWELGRQTDYAQHLLAAGQADAAYAWLQKQLDREIEYDRSADETLRTAYAELYRGQTRWTDLLKFTTEWISRKPEYQGAYTHHLSALVYNDKLDDANKLADAWLKDAEIEGKIAPDARARLDSALTFAQGNTYGLPYNNEIPERWFEPLDQAARYFARQKDHFDICTRIANDYRFWQNPMGDKFRGFIFSLLQKEQEKLSPDQVSTFVGWTLSGRLEPPEPIDGRKQLDSGEIPPAVWKSIANKLHERWSKTDDKDDKNSLSQSLQNLYSARFSESDLLPYLRERIEVGPKQFKQAYINSLFDTLLGRKWSDDNEKEVFNLLPKLTDSDEPADVLTVEVPALYRLVDAVIAGRQARADEELHDQGKTDELTRKELAAKKAEFAKVAKTEVAERLGAEAEKMAGPMRIWLQMEKAYLDLQLNQDLPQAAELCWSVLGELPAKPKDSGETAIAQLSPLELSAKIRTQFFDGLLHARSFTTVMNLAARRSAKPETIDRLLKYIDAGIEQGGDFATAWRSTKFDLLVALDRPDNLERQLRAWVRSEESTSPWRKALAMLLAERGQLDEAVTIFEALKKDDLLSAADYSTLSDWYLVKDRRDDYEAARIEAYKQLPEQAMNSLTWGLRNRWMRTDLPLPSQLDDNTLLAMRALFEKSANPENYIWQLRELYTACRDFRLLDMLPDAVLGRSPQQIYSYLQNMQGNILGEVRNEATADEILARIKKLREKGSGVRGPDSGSATLGHEPKSAERSGELTVTDQRALDLMEALVERRCSEVLNQPRPHVDACLAAMKRAFDRKWSEGEPVLMAGFLRNLGTLPHQPIIDEQIRELRALLAMAKPATRDHLVITDHICNLQFWSYNKHDSAIDEMQTEVAAYEQAHDGRWPHADNEILGSYVHLLEGATRHAAGEVVLEKYLAHPENDDQRKWLKDRLLGLYNSALESDGEVSLGKGNTLLENLVAHGLKELEAAPDENARQNMVARLVSTFEIGHRKNFKSTGELLETFAFEVMPVLLEKQQSQYRNTASAPLNVIAETLGPKLALRYVTERMEQYPPRLETTWDNRWQAFGYELARRRAESAEQKRDIADLEPRILKLTIAEIQRYIRTGQANNQNIYHVNYQWFWAEKADDFARAAEELYRQRKFRSSGRNVLSVANYLWLGLNRFDRAIEIMQLAFREELLDEGQQNQLAQWMHERGRFADSIPILEPLVKQHPDSMHYRTMLMVAYHQTGRQDQLIDLVKDIEAHFHEGGRWNEGNVSEFGKACEACGLNEKAVAYLTEAIALHQRAHGEMVRGDGQLSDWYQHLATSQLSLGHTKQAVDAASGAIVCWGFQQPERGNALNTLRNVLNGAKDLPEYVRSLDDDAKKTGQDTPILRKAVGQVLQQRGQYEQAIVQLEIAQQLQPTDKETIDALIACYDAAGDKPKGTQQLVKLIEIDSHNIPLYQRLADRLSDQPAEAERAITSIIEAGPQEAENHQALAEIRQRQNRWSEAIDQWTEVAKLRRLEPTGLVHLAEAQIHEHRWDDARDSITKLRQAEWPARFGDIVNQARNLQQRLPNK